MEPCQTVIVKLKNGVFVIVLDEVVSMEGTFQLSSEVNGRESWTTSSRAIWYLPEYKDWLIGNLDKRGTSNRFITSRFVYDLEQPYDVEYWNYYHSESWVTNGSATDVIVKCET